MFSNTPSHGDQEIWAPRPPWRSWFGVLSLALTGLGIATNSLFDWQTHLAIYAAAAAVGAIARHLFRSEDPLPVGLFIRDDQLLIRDPDGFETFIPLAQAYAATTPQWPNGLQAGLSVHPAAKRMLDDESAGVGELVIYHGLDVVRVPMANDQFLHRGRLRDEINKALQTARYHLRLPEPVEGPGQPPST